MIDALVKLVKNGKERWAYAIGLVVVFVVEFILRDFYLPENASNFNIGSIMVMEWLTLTSLVVFWIPKLEKMGLGSIGLGRFKSRYLWWGGLAYILVLGASMVSGVLLESVGLKSLRSLQPLIKGYNFITLSGLFLTGTFLEEVFYRGYLIERTTILTGHRWIAASMSWFLFTLVHLKFFGLGPTIDTSIISAALVLLYLKEKSIWPGVVLHGINDILAFLIFPLLIS